MNANLQAQIPRAVRVVNPAAGDVVVAALEQGSGVGEPMLCIAFEVNAGFGALQLEDGTRIVAALPVEAGRR